MSGTVVETPCFGCIQLLNYPKCRAYPNGIPDAICQGQDDHRKARNDEAKSADGKPYVFAPFGKTG